MISMNFPFEMSYDALRKRMNVKERQKITCKKILILSESLTGPSRRTPGDSGA